MLGARCSIYVHADEEQSFFIIAIKGQSLEWKVMYIKLLSVPELKYNFHYDALQCHGLINDIYIKEDLVFMTVEKKM